MTEDDEQPSEDGEAGRFEQFLDGRTDHEPADDGGSTERPPLDEPEQDTADDSASGERAHRNADEVSSSDRDGSGRWGSLGGSDDQPETGSERSGGNEADSVALDGTDDRSAGNSSERIWENRSAESESVRPDATQADNPDDEADSDGLLDGEPESDANVQDGESAAETGRNETSSGRSHAWERLGETTSSDSLPDDAQAAESGDRFGDDAVTDSGSAAGRSRGWPSPQKSTLSSHELSEVDSASQVLVLHSPEHRVDEVCETLLSGEPGQHNVLMITTEESITERLQVCRDSSIEEFVVIAVGGGRQGANETEVTESPTGSAVTTHRISSPTNLSRLGIVVSQTVSKWDSRDVRQTVCFHTLTHFLNYVETEQLFRFLQTLRGRFQGSDVGAHYHLDPNAFDDAVLGILDPIFDDVVDLSEDSPVDFRR